MQTVTIGSRAPGFDLPGVDGKNISLDSLLAVNKAIGVTFSCNHCPYVQGSEERMIALQKEFGPRGFVLVAINSNNDQSHPEDSFQKMKERASELGFNFPYLRDATQKTAKDYGAQRTPEVFLLDSSGKVRYHGRIDDSPKDAKAVKDTTLRNALSALLDGKKVPVENTEPIGCTIKWLPEESEGASCSV